MLEGFLMAASILALGEAGPDTLAGRLDGRELILQVEGSGVVCRGDVDPKGAFAALSCSDRRQGYIKYQLQDGIGTGYGRLGSEDLVVTFG